MNPWLRLLVWMWMWVWVWVWDSHDSLAWDSLAWDSLAWDSHDSLLRNVLDSPAQSQTRVQSQTHVQSQTPVQLEMDYSYVFHDQDFYSDYSYVYAMT